MTDRLEDICKVCDHLDTLCECPPKKQGKLKKWDKDLVAGVGTALGEWKFGQ